MISVPGRRAWWKPDLTKSDTPCTHIDSKFEEEDLWKRAIQAALRQFQGQVAAQNDEYALELPNLNSQGSMEEMDDYIRKSFGLAP